MGISKRQFQMVSNFAQTSLKLHSSSVTIAARDENQHHRQDKTFSIE
jgi:hypothetical protein